jgi:hypothetical protein
LLFDRAVGTLDEWKKIAFLHVEGSRLKTWHIPGMLLIGDAAQVMTPIGGVGINYIPIIRSLVPRLIALGGRRTHCEITDHFSD